MKLNLDFLKRIGECEVCGAEAKYQSDYGTLPLCQDCWDIYQKLRRGLDVTLRHVVGKFVQDLPKRIRESKLRSPDLVYHRRRNY